MISRRMICKDHILMFAIDFNPVAKLKIYIYIFIISIFADTKAFSYVDRYSSSSTRGFITARFEGVEIIKTRNRRFTCINESRGNRIIEWNLLIKDEPQNTQLFSNADDIRVYSDVDSSCKR